MRKFRIFSIAVLVLLLFATVSFGALVDLVPENAVVVLETKSADSVIDFLYSDQIKSLTGGELDLSEIRDEIKTGLGFDALDPEFLKDLFSGGMAISVTGFTEVGIPEVLIVVSPKDKIKFLKFIKAIEDKTGIQEEVSSYKGINITRLSLPNNLKNGPKELAWSMVGENIVLGLTAAPVKDAIEVSLGEKGSVTKVQDYVTIKSRVKEKLGDSPFFLYMAIDKFSTLFDILKGNLSPEQAKTFENSMSVFKTMKPMGLSGISSSEGVRIYGLMGMPAPYVKIYEGVTFPEFKSLELFPKNTFFYVGGIMPFSWEKLKELIPEASRKAVEESFAQLRKQVGIDIEGLFLSWLDKEFAIGVFDPSGMIPKVGLLLGYTDKAKVEDTVNTLLSKAGPALGGEPTDKEYEGVKYKSIENPMFPVGIGFVDERLVAANGIENMIDVSKGNMAGLVKSEALQEPLSAKGTTSIIYIELQTILSVIERFASMGEGLDEETKKVLDTAKKIKDIIYWAGYTPGDEYSFMWIKIENNVQ